MSEDGVKIDALIDSVRSGSTPDVATGATAMLNLIPYAGGAVASILGEFATNRRIQKICEVLAELNTGLERHKASAERYLSRDQIVELVYETLQAASVASDRTKVEALKAALVHSFVSPGSFDRKQFMLQMLRETTNVELAVLRALYDAPDPFIVGRGGPARTPENGSPKHTYLARGFWHTVGRTETGGSQSLLKYLTNLVHLDGPLVEASLRRLDGRGLSAAGANLERSDLKVVSWLPMPEEHIKKSAIASISFESGKNVPSPLEASKTKLGEEFLKVWAPALSA